MILHLQLKEILLGILIDSELNFDLHISSIRSKASKKLHALGHIATFMSFKKKHRTLLKTFIETKFNYYPLIWMFHPRRMNNKINRIHERALRLLYSDHVSSFSSRYVRRKTVFYLIQYKNGWLVPTTQMSISVLFVSAGVLFDGTFSL